MNCRLVLVKSKAKGRNKLTQFGERACSGKSESNARREREPWLIATSLPTTYQFAKRIVRLYATRMQIEEGFRYTKSVKFGLGFELNRSHTTERIQILLLIAMLATFVLWLLGAIAKQTGQSRHYHANTIKNRTVLSLTYLGLRVASDERFVMNDKDLNYAVQSLWKMRNHYGLAA